MLSVVARRGLNGAESLRPIPGFAGLFLAISPVPFKWEIDGVLLVSDQRVAVISTSHIDRVRLLRPWRKKKAGIEYGSHWIGMMDDSGKKQQFKLESLASLVFGERWDAMNQKLETKDTLGDLF